MKSSPMNVGNISLKAPLHSPIPKTNLTTPSWPKGCLRPHSPLRPRQRSSMGSSHSPGMSTGTNLMGSPTLSTGTGISIHDSSINSNESGTNRTLKRFMTMKKSKANEFLKRGKNNFRKRKRFFFLLLHSF